jgi:hypothetical protein
VITIHAECDACERCRGVLERCGARDEIGFGIQLSDCAPGPLHHQTHKPFSRRTIDLACSFCHLCGAEPIDRSFEIALRLRQRLLAINHTGAGSVS